MDSIDDIGKLGETLIAEWVPTKGGQVLATRWHCTFGEIDVVALNAQGDLIFIEVKTRRPRNIDEDGVLAVTRTKQRKLIQSAKLFLLKHSQHRSRNCRFDIALVRAQPTQANPATPTRPKSQKSKTRSSAFTRTIGAHELTLVNYIVNAFEAK
jgi:putative endonuclease